MKLISKKSTPRLRDVHDECLSLNSPRAHTSVAKKHHFGLFAVLRNSPDAGSIGTGERRSSREAACLLPNGRPPRQKQEKNKEKKEEKNYTCPLKNIKKPRGGIQNNSNRRTRSQLRGRGRVKLCVYSVAATLVLFGGENFERRFQFLRFASCATSMLSAGAPAARPVRLEPKRGSL